MYEPILDALRRGAALEALAAAREAVAAQPQDATAHRLHAAALRLNGEREAALAALDQALGLAPDDADLHLERAGLLLAERKLSEAEAALARATGLDPNQFPAYVIQAHLAIARQDLAEAERLTRTAARIAPEHPHVAALEGTLALRRGEADRALAILARAAERAPDEPQLRHALGFAYLAKGHFAFAEQAFRGLLERDPGSRPLRALIADLVRRQGRPAEAADELAPLLEGEGVTPAMRRLVGELELEAGRNERALQLLRQAFAEQPLDRRTVLALLEAWRRLGLAEEARSTLDAALERHPESDDLWRARLVFEPFAGDSARAVVARWQAAMPDYVPALEAQTTLHDHAGEHDQAEAVAQRITELQPGHAQAELRVLDGLLARDPDAAVLRVESLLARAPDPNVKRSLRQLLGRCFDIAGQPEAAAATWAELHAEVVDQRLPLPPQSDAIAQWPELAPRPEAAPGVLLLWGAPGSLVERLAVTFDQAGAPLRADRLGPQPPNDPLQRYTTVPGLLDGSLDPAYVVNLWRAALPARGVRDGAVFDWLLWWDNALLLGLRPHLPEAVLMVALRDPRDMLLDWLAFGSPVPYALASPEAGAAWLAKVLGQVAELHERDLFPHRLLRLDEIAQDPAGIAQAIGEALQVRVAPAPAPLFGPPRLAAGRWRAYAEPLREAFALLAPVAQRLGYPA
ncbi:tetratricopeptide repeat protein [Vulcaniibacterium tengchongense]|uniref:Flp pilus assembly protein TadD n=1 Tax=Vulcaniibacterium tengchongense TaxID=1273429 RepID=A0A3N4VLA8_9GAMM|nr:tetratricopeptide repeat protein [Vulcaniibacterium tengchongense]RPE80051.1 Flp pilus assembly protein TadD [Vulcaniibacterium tengchongense]